MGSFSLPEEFRQEAWTASGDTRFVCVRGQCQARRESGGRCSYSARTYLVTEQGVLRYCGTHAPDVSDRRRIDVDGPRQDTCDSVMRVDETDDPDKPGGIVHTSCSYRPFAAIFTGDGDDMALRCKLHLPGRWAAHLRR